MLISIVEETPPLPPPAVRPVSLLPRARSHSEPGLLEAFVDSLVFFPEIGDIAFYGW